MNDWVGEKVAHLAPPGARVLPRGPDAGEEVPGLRPHPAASPAGRPRGLGSGGGRSGPQAPAAHPGDDPGLAAGDLHRQAPLRRGLVGHRHLDGGAAGSAVAALVEPTEAARYLRFDSFDKNYYNGWDLTSAFHPQTILAYAFNDRPLGPERGAPLRLYSPVKLGYKLTKYLTKMTFTAERPGGYWEDLGYPWLGGI